ncbi:MAG: M15 family metallopeptidase [Desulfobacterales bacterium]|nr:M15 family metallopeptidase [Desulfobacterales bacterium]
MKRHIKYSVAFILILTFISLPAFGKPSKYEAVKTKVPHKIAAKMNKFSYKNRCPIKIKDLVYIKLKHWGFDGKAHNGELIVHKAVGDDIVGIFKDLFNAKFPIEKIHLIDKYKGSDDFSMADNNTSAFNCRAVTGRPGVFSKHSYGVAIDINPVQNPYISKKEILPPDGSKYVDRTNRRKGLIVKWDAVYKAFTKRGWTWGGSWRTLKDYQHFQKKLN